MRGVMENMHLEKRTARQKQQIKIIKFSSPSKSRVATKITYALLLINISRDFPEGD
jgi:hypothetical protein